MESIKNNKIFWLVVLVSILNIGLLTSGFFADKVADIVIKKLQKNYSPSPYGPGLDPDKVSPENLKTSDHKSQFDTIQKSYASDDYVRYGWEKNRGF